ncbi:radical SAM protein, partial [Bacillus sp. SS-TM]
QIYIVMIVIASTAGKVLALIQMNFSLHSFDGHPGSQDKEGYVRSILSFIREATSQSDLIVSLRLWNLTQDNKTNAEIQKNRELLSIIENEFDLSYQIEEKLTPGKGIKIAERVFINNDADPMETTYSEWQQSGAPEFD